MQSSNLTRLGVALVASQLALAGAFAQIVILEEDLEDGGSLSYTANEFDLSSLSFFHRTNDATKTDTGAPPFDSSQGYFFNMQNTTNATGGFGVIDFASLDVSAYQSLTVSIDVGLGTYSENYDSGLVPGNPRDLFQIQYDWDAAGSYSNLGQFLGNDAFLVSGVGFDVTGLSPSVSEVRNPDLATLLANDPNLEEPIPFHTVSFELADLTGGTDLYFRLFADMTGNGHILAWDNFKVTAFPKFDPGPVQPVPEPSTYGLLGAAALLGLIVRRRLRR